jgi:hypothetical protein
MASNFKEFKVKVTVDTKDGNQAVEQTIKSLKDYEKVLDDLNKKKTKPGITKEELEAIDKEIKQMGTDFQQAGNKILLVNQDLDVTARNLKLLQKEQKTFGIGTDEYRRAADKIQDFKEKLEGAKRTQLSFGEQLENASGPIGTFFQGLEKVKNSFISVGGAIKATGIGLLVSVIGFLVEAFSKTEGSTKKLQPLLIQMEKIFGGIVSAVQPLLDGFVELATKAMPYVTDAFKVAYSAVTAFFQSLGHLGSAVMKLIKGDFAGAWDEAKTSVTSFGDNYDKGVKRFEEGAAKQTKTQKENADKQKEIMMKRLDDQKEAIDKSIQLEVNKYNTDAKLLEEDLKKRDEIENKKWELEHKGRKVSAETLKLQKEERDKFIKDALQADKDAAKAAEDLENQKFDSALDKIKEAHDTEIGLKEALLKKTEILLGKESEAYKKQQLEIWTLKKKAIDDEIAALTAKAEAGGKLSDEEYKRLDGLALASLNLGNEIIQSNKDVTLSDEQKAQARKDLDKEMADFELEQSGTTFDRQVELIQQEDDYMKDKREKDKKDLDDDLESKKISQQDYDDKIKKINFQAVKDAKTTADAKQKIEDIRFAKQMDQAQGYANMVGALSSLIGKDTIAGKALGIAQATINTYIGASEALKQKSTLPSPFDVIAKVVNVATIIATGLKTVKEITNVSVPDAQVPEVRIRKAMGGILQGPTHAMGGIGTNLGELEGGEYVVNRASTMMFRPQLEAINTAGGGMRDYGYGGFNGGTGNNQQPIFKTYVVASEMSDQQELNRVIKERSKI